MHAGLQQGGRSQHVDAGVEDGVVDGAANAGLRRLVEDGLGPLDAEQLVDPGRPQVHLVEARVRLQMLDVAGREVVQDDHVVAVGQQPIGDVGSDEARASRDEDLQRR